jgi:acid phosphatase
MSIPCSTIFRKSSKTVAVLLLAVVATLAGSSVVYAGTDCTHKPVVEKGEIQNLGLWKQRLIFYKLCGEYDRDVSRAFGNAERYILKTAPHVHNPAIVFDIDETTLDNWKEISANDFGYIPGGDCTFEKGMPCGAGAWEKSHQAVAIAPALALFKAVEDKVAVFFVTGRGESTEEREATETNLKQVGYDKWVKLYMRGDGFKTVADYKSAQRADIEKSYTIVANIGDQKSDLAEGHEMKGFKIPNPFYFIP